MWTGHFDSVFKGELTAAVRTASQAWQKSRGHAPTETLPTEQIIELVTQGLKERDEVGWSILHDNAVGIALGFPTKLVTFDTPRNESSALWYCGTGAINQSVAVHMGFPSCRSMDSIYQGVTARASFRARLDNGFVARFHQGDRDSYLSWICHPAGSVSIEITAPVETLQAHPGLFAALSSSVTLLRTPDPTVRPRPKVEDLPLASSGFSDDQPTKPQPQAKAKPAK